MQTLVLSGWSVEPAVPVRWLRPFQSLTVGRSAKAELEIPFDKTMSDLHFMLENTGQQILVTNLSKTDGIYVNGSRSQQSLLQDGDIITAGETSFVARIRIRRVDLTVSNRNEG